MDLNGRKRGKTGLSLWGHSETSYEGSSTAEPNDVYPLVAMIDATDYTIGYSDSELALDRCKEFAALCCVRH